MPLYEYECPSCGRFERIRKFSDPALIECPTCGGPIEKLFSSPAVHFKGSGWYVTDYARKPSTEGGSKEGAKTDGKPSEGSSTSASSSDSAKESAAASPPAKTGSSGSGGSSSGSGGSSGSGSSST